MLQSSYLNWGDVHREYYMHMKCTNGSIRRNINLLSQLQYLGFTGFSGGVVADYNHLASPCPSEWLQAFKGFIYFHLNVCSFLEPGYIWQHKTYKHIKWLHKYKRLDVNMEK